MTLTALKRGLALIAVCFYLSGCAHNSVFVNYPSQIAPIKQGLNSNTPLKGASQLEPAISGNDGLLYAQEAGRIAQIAGDFDASKQYYQQAITRYLTFDDEALISASQLGSTASSFLFNDNVIPYRGPGYERILLHQYQALNYLFSGDPQGALVEVRRSNELQSLEQEKYQKSLKSIQSLANGSVDSEVARLEEASGNLSSSFLNAYSYYVTGLLHEILGEPNDAFIDYRKAAQIAPRNPFVQQDIVRLANQLKMPQAQEFEQRFGQPVFAGKHQGQVVIIIEKAFVPIKQSFTVPFTIDGNIQTAALATYPSRMPAQSNVTINGLSNPMTAATIANIDALAITALKEDLPAALARQAARVYAKSEIASSITSNSKRGRNELDIGSIAIQLFNVVSEQADRRSWLTLPRQAQIARQYADSGEYTLNLDNTNSTQITVEPGRTTLIWAIDTGNYLRFYSILI
ncbi:COG3014 family protein [Shewanella gelidii]|uniref:Tetratricopeptide repeat protein n=1 Tax=Shewanella gelidii TaxID=1642821 RepID=A0A917JMJ9_9GAMM|nr:hypothetical protein [Shewanella gelidii]MCL1099301.1 hypothetical protein [Shewanella gelidii]GGI77597.1 hypothetical protein GCM10009332_13680 [Shewanella gelidii]